MHSIVALCYFGAFLSLSVQWDGLFGPGGLIPADGYADVVRNHYRTADFPWHHTYVKFPSLIAAISGFGTVEGLAHFGMLFGMIASILIVLQKGPAFIWFFVCWVSYMSLYLIGQTFLSFQWDILLLEVGFLCIISSSAPGNSPAPWPHRFLAWKLMFLSGCVKLQAKCPRWETLTALEYHFATQPLPTPLSWSAHQVAPTLLRLGVLGTLVIEIPLTFMLLLPNSNLRKAGAIVQILLQTVIAATGNYTFFNLLTACLMLQVYSSESGALEESRNFFTPFKTCLFTVVYTFFCVSYMLDMDYLKQALSDFDDTMWWSGSPFRLQEKLWQNRIAPYTGMILGVAMVLVLVQILLGGFDGTADAVKELVRCKNTLPKKSTFYQKITGCGSAVGKVLKIILITAACFVMVPLSAFSMQGVASSPLLPKQFIDLATKLQPMHLTSGYGLFRQMTGVWIDQDKIVTGAHGKRYGYRPQVVARPELVVEGLDADTDSWETIHFKYKPGDVNEAPRWVAPHQPRLDWQMWFAALGTHQRHPWVANLCYKLMTKDNAHIWNLLDTKKNAKQWGNGEETRIPRSMRITRYDYSFTFQNSSWARAPVPDPSRTTVIADSAGVREAAQWWHRTNPVPFLDPIDVQNQQLQQFLYNNRMGPRQYVSPAVGYKRCVLGLDFVHDAPRYIIRNTACVSILVRSYLQTGMHKLGDLWDIIQGTGISTEDAKNAEL